ncbi:uncharacterized protein RJT21DRAFT_113968 [Scheffersomyces amazonensis]|uniref:uncharacterized protein n=1 Tax=Scheffersomyces amazonensis TaxID=1078765 RepID=UPI00315CC953
MSWRSNLPGSYPVNPPTSPGLLRDPNSNVVASKVLEHDLLEGFEEKYIMNQKSKHQSNIFSQLDNLVYILVGYQFIKYAHSACLLPILLHISLQKVVGNQVVRNNSNGRVGGILGLLMLANDDDDIDLELRNQIKDIVMTKTCSAIYWKTVFTIFYHSLFIMAWVMPITNHNRLSQIEHGTWWFISFIGEDTPNDITSTSSYWTKLSKLGLPGLIITDLIILFIQLVLYQCIYKQSTYLNQDRSINEREIFLVRAVGDSGKADDSINIHAEYPLVLKVKLYECFMSEAFIPDIHQ